MFRPDRATLRSAGFVVLLTGVFLMVNTQVVYAAGSNSETGDLLAPLNIYSSEGVPIDGYDLNASGGSIVAFKTQALAFALSGLFTLIRLLVGLAGWAIEVAFRFPLLKLLTKPAQKVADTYDTVVVDTLGIKGLLLAWAFVFAGFMIVRGRVGRGLGEIFLTLLIGAIAASALIRPDTMLGPDGPLGQSQQVAAEVAQESVNSYDWGGKLASYDPCAGMAGNAEIKCEQREGEGPVSSTEVARPIQDSITNALIVKPYMLLQYGRILDPAKPADRKAYAVHLKWITGGYKAGTAKDDKDDPCRLVKGPAKKWCQRGDGDKGTAGALPELTPGGELLDAANPVVSAEDQEFAAFLADMKKAGPVGKSCAAYAEQPTWWRVGGAFLLLIAALFICGMLLSSAIVLLGTQGICAAAAAVGGVTFVAGMLPGPARQSVWKWLSIWGIAVLAVVGICAFIPFFGIAIDATITNGPDLMVERILLIDVLAIAGAAGHRRLLTGITSFGRRMAMRMRYAKVGGTHMPGDTSELGAALAMNSPTAIGGYGGGLRAFTGGGGGRFGMLGTRQRLMGALTSLVDGAGMPVDTGGLLADATAEAGRGLAPLTAAAAVGGLGARLGGKGAHWLLIGRRPDREQLAKWRKPTADGDPGAGGPSGGGGSGGAGPRRPSGPPDRYRNDQGQVVDRNTGQVLHDQNSDRTLLSTRAHNRLVRFRGYRILNRGGRAAYGATVGLPANVRRARSGGSRYSQDARQQVRVWGNTVREDRRAWGDTGRHVAQVLRDHTDDSGGSGPFANRRLPAVGTPAATPRPAAPARPAPPTGGPAAPPPAPLPPRQGPPPVPRSDLGRPAHPGGGNARNPRDEARDRMRELMRRTEPDADRLGRLRQVRDRWQDEDGEGE
ncbi:hypothetical protein OG895_43630 [Streptomyces sp. NBC_00201]|uniref:hypothetical protein n=1 Tax=unclassified Streptomyces TaxID=2593676 RepID=UPI002251EC24|nr:MULTISPECIES: hypothetical protein [unclassified Streptomyces]MCX5251942.1 hypothetical protein [Streptomyces sp. NBC_00201]MCX5294123.1 hypothetical protein [Streptomyces sp. NBC_00183]